MLNLFKRKPKNKRNTYYCEIRSKNGDFFMTINILVPPNKGFDIPDYIKLEAAKVHNELTPGTFQIYSIFLIHSEEV